MKAVLLAIAMFCLAAPLQAQEQIELKTEAYPPFGFRDSDGSLKGAGVDQVEMLMHDAGLAYGLEMVPWARAIALAETQPNHCVFSAALTPDRQNRFKWVLSLSTSASVLVRHAETRMNVTSFEDAKQYTVGSHRGDFTEALLKNRGFPKIEVSADFDTSLQKLLDHRIDMMPMSENVYERLKRYGTPIEKDMLFAQQKLGIACNKDMADQTIGRMQEALDQLKRDGRQAEIYKRYGLAPPK